MSGFILYRNIKHPARRVGCYTIQDHAMQDPHHTYRFEPYTTTLQVNDMDITSSASYAQAYRSKGRRYSFKIE